MFKEIQLLTLFIVLILLLISCNRFEQFPAVNNIKCDTEIVKDNKLLANTDSTIKFSGQEFRTKSVSRSGNYSIMTLAGVNPYAFNYIQHKCSRDIHLVISVWRKSKNGKGSLVCQDKDADYYQQVNVPVEIDSNGWEKLELYTILSKNSEFDYFSIYVWNPSGDTIYFDDFEIRRSKYKKYPDFNEEKLAIVLDTSDYIKIMEKREIAIEEGILQTSDDDWVNSILFGEDKMMKAKIRLKGDWLDHLRGDKWSFRIKIRNDNVWNRMRVFSIQTPFARGFLREWISHEFYLSKDLLTTRYGFVPFSFNNRSKGYYAWEEHFDKILPEWNKRREGPILKFSDEAYWQWIKLYANITNRQRAELPHYDAAVIKPFRASKTVSDTLLFKQYLNAQKLVFQYKNHLKIPSEIFDLKKLASYYAMGDLLDMKHGIGWNNIRFYFNPVLCKIEPIAFDCYSGIISDLTSHSGLFAYQYLTDDLVYRENSLIKNIFIDSTFLSLYLSDLKEFSQPDFVNTIMDKLKPKSDYYDSLIRMEFPQYKYNDKFIIDNAEYIRNQLPALEEFIKQVEKDTSFNVKVINEFFFDTLVYENTAEFFVNAYTREKHTDSTLISIYNYYPNDIIILGTGKNNKFMNWYQHPEPLINKFDGSKDVASMDITSYNEANYLYFMLKDGFETYITAINPWPHPDGITPQQELMTKVNLCDSNIIDTIIDRNIFIRKDDIWVDYPIIIPSGYTVNFEQGTTIDLVNKACFISYSPLKMSGTHENHILITSSDSSAKGFTILQAANVSELNYVSFENLNTLDFDGWTLTGAVTFYESDVEMNNVSFYRNQCEDALNTIRSSFSVKNSRFESIFGDAFDSDFCDGEVINTSFSNIGNDAIDFSGSTISITDVLIDKALDKGISGGEESYLSIKNTVITGSNIGLASKDLSTVEIDNSEIKDCVIGLVLFMKKPEFGPAKMIVNNTSIKNTDSDMIIEKGSMLLIGDKVFEGNKKNIAEFLYK